MPKFISEGALTSDQPHPGTITRWLRWSDSMKILKASDFSDFDFAVHRVDRSRAACCSPVVEIDTGSADEDGKNVAPKDAESIESATCEPGRVFLDRATMASRTKGARRSVPASAMWGHRIPHVPSSVLTFPATSNLDAAMGARESRVTLWRRVRRGLPRPGAARLFNPNPLLPHDH